MKRLNLILFSETKELRYGSDGGVIVEEGDIKFEDLSEEQMTNIRLLNEAIALDPSLAEDPEVKKLISLHNDMQKYHEKNGGAAADKTANTDKADKTETVKTDKNDELSGLSFFSEGTSKVDFKGVKVDNLQEFAQKNLKVDTSKDNWLEDLLSNALGGNTEETIRIQREYESVRALIGNLPKELQLAINDAAENKNWRERIALSGQLDFEKDFKDMTKAQKIAVHNFFFPEDKLADDADVSDKTISKSLSLAEARFKTEKQAHINSLETETQKKKDSDTRWNQSVDASMQNLSKEYPSFSKTKLKTIENLIKKDGLFTLFLNNDGTVKPSAAKAIAFALEGENILKAAVAMAENKGKSKGKEELINGSASRGAGRSVTENLTEVEKKLLDEYEKASGGVGASNPY